MIRAAIIASLLAFAARPALAVESRIAQQEHAHETPAAQAASRQQHRKGVPDHVDPAPGGAYAPSDTASSSGKPPDAVPKR